MEVGWEVMDGRLGEFLGGGYGLAVWGGEVEEGGFICWRLLRGVGKCYAVGGAGASCVWAGWKGRRLKRYRSLWSIAKSSLTGTRKLIL